MVKINFQTEKGKSSVWIPKDTILQVVRNTGTYKQEDENGERERERERSFRSTKKSVSNVTSFASRPKKR